MLKYLTVIFCFQLGGELANRLFPLTIPGPVIGMIMLFAFLLWRGGIPDDLGHTADGLLKHFSLLFVPSGVGVMLHFRLLGDDWLPIGVALVVSTLVTIAVTAWMMRRLDRNPTAAPEEIR